MIILHLMNNKVRSSSFDEYKKKVAQQYTEEWEYWKNVYNGKRISCKEGDDVLYAQRRDIILRLVDDFADNRMLKIIDVGCGTGVLGKCLLERGHSVVGIDISDKMVEVAQKAAEGA